MTIYGFDDYKEYLNSLVESQPRGTISRMAAAAGCQRSYFSQVLTSHVNLTSDQVYNLSMALQLCHLEQEYFLLLLEKAKAATFSYKTRVVDKINEIKAVVSRLSDQIGDEIQQEVINQKYYSTWYYSAIHIATSIDVLKTEKDFANFFGLPPNVVQEALNDLRIWNLIKLEKGSWNYNQAYQLHLKDNSLLNQMNHTNWRSCLLSKPIIPEKNINYTSVFTVSKKDAHQLKLKLLDFIKEQRSEISASSSEELMVFNCDFVSLSPS